MHGVGLSGAWIVGVDRGQAYGLLGLGLRIEQRSMHGEAFAAAHDGQGWQRWRSDRVVRGVRSFCVWRQCSTAQAHGGASDEPAAIGRWTLVHESSLKK